MPTTWLNPRWLSEVETTNTGIFIVGNHPTTLGTTAIAPAIAAATPEVKAVANSHQAAVAAALRVASAWAWA
jgi:hypothetical protein